jgi:hypothetical protein
MTEEGRTYAHSDREKAGRAKRAMYRMMTIVIAGRERACRG